MKNKMKTFKIATFLVFFVLGLLKSVSGIKAAKKIKFIKY